MKKNIIFLCILIIPNLFSCEKTIQEPISNNEENKSVDVINGFLVFESDTAFVSTINSIAILNGEERRIWEDEINFISQRRVVDNVIMEEIIHDENLEAKFVSGEITENDDFQLFSDAYYKALEDGIIKIIDEGTEDEYWDYAVFSRSYVNFINVDGLYAIGNTLYQVTENSMKMMKNADLNNPQILIEATEDDIEKNIYITKMESFLKSVEDSPGLIESEWVEVGTGKKGDKRIKVGICLEVIQYSTGDHKFWFTHDVYVQCQERNWLRIWKYQFTPIVVDGEWNMFVYRYPEYYSSDYSYSGSCSYFKSSVNPGDGSTSPYQAVWIVIPWNFYNENYPYLHNPDYAPNFQSYEWSAYRADANLEAVIVK